MPLIDANTPSAGEPAWGSIRPTRPQRADAAFARPLLAELAEQGIARAIAVRERDVIAVQAVEDLESMIDRAGSLCRRKGWVLAAGGGSRITPETVARLAAAGGRCLVLPDTHLADKAAVVRTADRLGVALLE